VWGSGGGGGIVCWLWFFFLILPSVTPSLLIPFRICVWTIQPEQQYQHTGLAASSSRRHQEGAESWFSLVLFCRVLPRPTASHPEHGCCPRKTTFKGKCSVCAAFHLEQAKCVFSPGVGNRLRVGPFVPNRQFSNASSALPLAYHWTTHSHDLHY